MDWLSRNAAAIQALASLASLVVTAVLVILTAWYVRVTKQIAQSSVEQTRHLKEAARALTQNAARSLVALSTRIRVPFAGLKARGLSHQALREYPLLSEEDVSQLESLALQVGGEAARYAGKAAVSLRKLTALFARAQSINEGKGWTPSLQEQRDWDEATDAGPKMLTALEQECQKIVAA
jgi:hypothetical protein